MEIVAGVVLADEEWTPVNVSEIKKGGSSFANFTRVW
jgi:hypothetical protein